MKEIKSDKVFEKKIRIYQINRLEELNDFYQKNKREYKNMNGLLASLIFADSEINFEKDVLRKDKEYQIILQFVKHFKQHLKVGKNDIN